MRTVCWGLCQATTLHTCTCMYHLPLALQSIVATLEEWHFGYTEVAVVEGFLYRGKLGPWLLAVI